MMCMLYGFSARNNFNLEPTLIEFFQKSIFHPDGWGIGFYEGDKAKVIKEPYRALNRPRTRCMGDVGSNLCIAHIRKATRGKNQIENTHPFTARINGKEWIFAHNGTVEIEAFEGIDLHTKGNTDSEKCFMYIKRVLEAGEDEIEAIEAAVKHLAKYGKFNMLLSDGKKLYVHTNMKGTLFQYKKDGLMCMVTQRLNKVKEIEKWLEIPLNRLFACQYGEITYVGKIHEFEHKQLTK